MATTKNKKTTAKKQGVGSRTKSKAKANRQTGRTTVKIDREKQAKKPGKRISATGRVYYERRADRSDVGKLLGALGIIDGGSPSDLCYRRNPDGSTTIYGSRGGDKPCPYGGRVGAKKVVALQPIDQVPLNGAKSKKSTSNKTASQKKFAIDAKKARDLVKSGKAKTLKSAWAMLKK